MEASSLEKRDASKVKCKLQAEVPTHGKASEWLPDCNGTTKAQQETISYHNNDKRALPANALAVHIKPCLQVY